ncbi:hypothetical protein [Nostoc sp.]
MVKIGNPGRDQLKYGKPANLPLINPTERATSTARRNSEFGIRN